MTQADAMRIDALRQALIDAGQRRRWLTFTARAAEAGAWWLAAVLAVIVLDAIAPLPGEWRLAIGLALLAAIPVLLWRERVRSADPRRAELREARALETHHGLAHHPLTTGLQLDPARQPPTDPLAAHLAERVHHRGQTLADSLDTAAAIDRRPLRRATAHLWLVAVAWLVTAAILPHLILGGLGRLMLPLADIPPFSLTRIAVAADPDDPTAGDDVLVHAAMAGLVPDTAHLVELDGEGRERRRWPMRPAAQDGFIRTLEALREPITLRVEAGSARSRAVTIEPRPREDDPDAEDELAARGPGETGESDAGEAPPTPTLRDVSFPENEWDGFLQSQLPEIYRNLQELARQAGEIQRMAAALQEAADAGASPQELAERIAELESALQGFRGLASQTAGMCRAAMEDASPREREFLERLARQLDALSLAGLGMCPGGGLPGEGDGMTPSLGQGEGVGTGYGSGMGMGGGGRMVGPAGAWMLAAQAAALSDLQMIESMLGQFLALSPVGSAGPHDAEATALPEPEQPFEPGRYDETMRSRGDVRGPADAAMQAAPPAYRDLIRLYFNRLAEDDAP